MVIIPEPRVRFLFSYRRPATMRRMLFEMPHDELTDEEIAAVLRQSIANAGRLPRHADVYLAGICAEHLVDGLRAAGLLVIRPLQRKLRQ